MWVWTTRIMPRRASEAITAAKSAPDDFSRLRRCLRAWSRKRSPLAQQEPSLAEVAPTSATASPGRLKAWTAGRRRTASAFGVSIVSSLEV